MAPKKLSKFHTANCGDSIQQSIQHLQEYKESLKIKAEQLLLKGFPEKIAELNQILETPHFRSKNFIEVHQDLNVLNSDPIALNHADDLPPAKKMKLENNSEGQKHSGSKATALPNKSVPCNQRLCDLINIAKPYIRQLLEDSKVLKMWISFMIPKIEDGNNFGVSIQKYTLAEIKFVEREVAEFSNQILSYFVCRGKMVSNLSKYPYILDYKRAVQELDNKEYVSLCSAICEIRNCYCSLHDVLIKNLEKIKQPRSSNVESFY